MKDGKEGWLAKDEIKKRWNAITDENKKGEETLEGNARNEIDDKNE